MVRAEYQKAWELGEQCLRLAERVQDSATIVAAEPLLGLSLFLLGEFPLAHAHLEQAIALYDPSAAALALDRQTWCGRHWWCSLDPVGAWLSRPGPGEEP